MLSHISLRTAFLALLFLGATVLPPSLQGQESAAADQGTISAQALTLAFNPILVNTAAQAMNAETSIMFSGAGSAPLMASRLALPDPLLVPFGRTLPVPASPIPFSMAPKQDDGVHVGANLALMGVGAAALVTGLVLDNDAGTILAVGGGVVALIGFYRWLK